MPDGSYYEGQVKDGKAQGKGTLFQVDGTFWQGEWINNI